MKFGFFGGAILLMLTLVFSYIAIQNNKIAKEITLKSFGLDKPKAQALQQQPAVNDNNASMVQDINETKRENTPKVETKEAEAKDDKWQKFDEKFKDFDKKFENF